MEKRNQSSLPLLTLLPDGKVENDVRITDKAVTGICTVYLNRTDNENEFFLREIGVAALDGENLTEAVRTAVNEAYDAAISHLAGTMLPAQSIKAKESVAKPTPGPKQSAPGSTVKDNAPKHDANLQTTAEPDPVPDTGTEKHSSVDLGSIVDMPGRNEDGSAGESVPINDTSDNTAENSGVERIEFGGSLFPASDLMKSENSDVGDEDGVNSEHKKAMDMEITIFGKLHDCNGWKAGKILSERPDVIIDFCHRNSESYNGPKYTGPRVEQKEALFTLYPEAVRKVDRAA